MKQSIILFITIKKGNTKLTITFGTTTINAPATPDLAGIPILKANSPEKS